MTTEEFKTIILNFRVSLEQKKKINFLKKNGFALSKLMRNYIEMKYDQVKGVEDSLIDEVI